MREQEYKVSDSYVPTFSPSPESGVPLKVPGTGGNNHRDRCVTEV